MSWMDILKLLVFVGGVGFIITFFVMLVVFFVNEIV